MRDDMDIEAHLDRLRVLLDEARPVPLSSSVMVQRRDFDVVIEELRGALPEEVRQARRVLKERDDLLAGAGRERDQLLAEARAEQERLVSGTEVARAAEREAGRILDEARDEARRLRLESEDYVDGKLAGFEIVLNKTLRTVEKGARAAARAARLRRAGTGRRRGLDRAAGDGRRREGPGAQPGGDRAAGLRPPEREAALGRTRKGRADQAHGHGGTQPRARRC